MSTKARKPLERISEKTEMENKENDVCEQVEINVAEEKARPLRRSGTSQNHDDEEHLSTLLAKMEENYKASVDRLTSELDVLQKTLKKTNESLQMERYRSKNQKKEIEKRAEKEGTLLEKQKDLQNELNRIKNAQEDAKWKDEMQKLERNYMKKLESLNKELDEMKVRMTKREEELTEELGFMQEQLKQYETEKSSIIQSNSKALGVRDEYLDNLQQKIGSLTATKEHLLNQIEEREAKIVEIESELLNAQMRTTQVECELDTAQQAIVEAEGNSTRTSRYLLEEQEKIRAKRAEYLAELVRLRRDHELLVNEHAKCSNLKDSQYDEMKESVSKLERKISQLEEELKTAKEAENDLDKIRNEQNKAEIALNEERKKTTEISKELLKEKARNDGLKKALKDLDQQLDVLMESKRRSEATIEKYQAKFREMEQKLAETKSEVENFAELKTVSQQLKEDNSRLTEKVAYLQDELSSTHNDYREELSNLAKQICTKTEKSSSEIDGLRAKINKIEAEKRQSEATLRATQRQLDQAKLEAHAADKRAQEAREEQKSLVAETEKLKSAMVDAIGKIEKYKEQAETQKELNTTMDSKIAAAIERSAELESQLMSLNECVEQKDNLIAYLRSQIEVKQTQKMKPSSSQSTLVSVVSNDSRTSYNIESEIESCRELEKQRNQLQMSLERRKDVLEKRRRDPRVGNGETSLLRTTYDASSASSLNSDRNELGSNFSLSSRGVGTMRHDIPHRFNSYLVWKGAKCAVCLEGVSRVRYAYKCVECNIIVHRTCAANVVNTCGLPLKCADFYLESHTSASSANVISGWVKVFRSDDDSGRWRSFWASIDDHFLRFFENDKAASANNPNPQIAIDLEVDSWRIQSGSASSAPIEGGDSRRLLIEIQLSSYRLFMLAPTLASKQKWVQTLQMATNKRMFVRRHSSTAGSEGTSLLLALDSPHNLTVNCSQVVDDDWLLIGAQEGLFVCSVSNPRVPFNVAGLFAVYHIELIASIETLLIITGSSRHLFALHLRDLHASLESRHPSVQMTPVGNISNCHLMMVDRQKLPRFICVATPDHIHVLHYNARLDMFTPSHSISTIDPCMGFLSLPNGFIFAADHFYVVDMQTLRPEPILIEGLENDLPVAAVSICERELLLAYNNTGVFVDLQGNRTRKEHFYWSRAPMEFVYTAPYLYVVYTESLEILRIVDYTGPDSKTMKDDLEVYRCKNAHFTGRGVRPNDVVFVLSSAERVELHVFNNALPGFRKGSFKHRRLEAKGPVEKKSRF
ncbi:hypothetical protein QR680_013175 [Steinernema hermaphroditum]|uniref:Non-specific serine/threonine protein kinase n=1 Tax=Steinernema hermaphroditum TaxID=289476 RepID=A0AA39I4M1_9BILA|nr:hypothetical protein QR680_013175 [Steinernema hermaphroditum]